MRLVFDTHYFRGLQEPVLQELRRRGFALSVSNCAYLDALHRAFEDQQPNIFFAPAKRFAAFVDPAYPVAAVAGDLLTRLGALVPEGRPRATGRLHLAENWRVRARESTDETERRSLEIIRGADAHKLRRAMVRFLREVHPAPRMRPPRPADHFHAYLAVMGRRLLRSGRGAETPTGNGAQDLAQLMHIGERAVVVTRDEKLLNDVDASWTFQAPWVRTLVEVRTGPLPLGRPWGRTPRAGRRRSSAPPVRRACTGRGGGPRAARGCMTHLDDR